MARATVAWLLSLVWLAPAAEAAGPPADDGGLQSDEVGRLYSSQVHFGPRGMPLVTIGLMEAQPRVELSSPGGLWLHARVELDGQLVDRSLRLPPGVRLRLRPVEAVPAEVLYWCAVESLSFSRKGELAEALARWQERGERVQVFEVGSVFGIGGRVIDNRTYILGIRSFSDERAAENAARQVFLTHGSRTFVHAQLARRPSGSLQVEDARGRVREKLFELARVSSDGEAPIEVHRVEHGRGYAWHGFEDRRFAGEILVTLDRSGGLTVINRVPVDRLLEGLVPAEIFPNAPMEALKAQAVVARGEVFAKIGTRHFLEPYQLCAETHCQVYSGVGAEHPRASQAVRATQGELLFLGPELVDSVYSAVCGGHSEDAHKVWNHPPSPALEGRPDMPPAEAARWSGGLGERLSAWLEAEPEAYCRRSSYARKGLFRWEKTIPAAEMERLVAAVRPIGQVMSIQVLERGVSGRALVVRVAGSQGDLVVQRELPIRKLFGGLKSAMFLVDPLLDAEQMVTGFRFRGGGWGHGAGMCQVGATGMAEQGHSYREILAHYYNGARPVSMYGRDPSEGGAEQRGSEKEK